MCVLLMCSVIGTRRRSFLLLTTVVKAYHSFRNRLLVIFKSSSLFSTMIGTVVFIFFFSSRRRHTRSTRDWSSDVCSSDLLFASASRYWIDQSLQYRKPGSGAAGYTVWTADQDGQIVSLGRHGLIEGIAGEIGRASCRERV